MSRDCIWQKTTQEGVVEARRPAKCISVLSVHSVRSSDLNISSFCELPAFAQSIDANTQSLMLKEMMNLFAACRSLLCLMFLFLPQAYSGTGAFMFMGQQSIQRARIHFLHIFRLHSFFGCFYTRVLIT